MELQRNVWVPILFRVGTYFSSFRSLGLLSAGRFGQKGDLEGVQKWGQKRERKRPENGAMLVSFFVSFSGPNREDVVFEKSA